MTEVKVHQIGYTGIITDPEKSAKGDVKRAENQLKAVKELVGGKVVYVEVMGYDSHRNLCKVIIEKDGIRYPLIPDYDDDGGFWILNAEGLDEVIITRSEKGGNKHAVI